MRSAAVGHHFAHPGNRFWKVLHQAGFTAQRLKPEEDAQLLPLGVGVTNLVGRPTVSAAELAPDELRHAVPVLLRKVRRLQPAVLAVVGVTAYRTAWRRPRATLGEQPARFGAARLWVVPNPSGLQARYQIDEMVHFYRDLRLASRERG
jgi:double-stranded uracil-DNA glycosylase